VLASSNRSTNTVTIYRFITSTGAIIIGRTGDYSSREEGEKDEEDLSWLHSVQSDLSWGFNCLEVGPFYRRRMLTGGDFFSYVYG
jgi:hypothetical protein